MRKIFLAVLFCAMFAFWLAPSVRAATATSSITVLSPNGGEQWFKGQTFTITWQANGVSKVGIQWERDNPDGTKITAQNIALNITGSNGKYSWKIPTNLTAGTNYKIIIWDTTKSKTVLDASDNFFSIATATTTIACNDSDGGTDYYVKGTAKNSFDSFTDYCVNSAQIYEGICNTGGTIKRSLYTCPSGCQNGACKQPIETITITVPNGGEQWQLGSEHTILWTPYDPNATTTINSSKDVTAYLDKIDSNGKFVEVGKVVESGKASIHWSGEINQYNNFPAPGSYYIRVVNNKTGATDRSNKSFKLLANNTLKADLKINNSDGPITIPEAGATYNVSWRSTNVQYCNIYNNNTNQALENLPTSGSRTMSFQKNDSPYETHISLFCYSKSPIEGSAYDYVVIPKSFDLKITSPNGGESLDLSKQYYISWLASSEINKVSVALYKDDKFFRWIIKDLSMYSSGYFQWSPASTISAEEAGSNFKIYMIGYKNAGGTVEDKSDATFSIFTTPVSGTLSVSQDGSTPRTAQLIAGTNGVEFSRIALVAAGNENILVTKIKVAVDFGNSNSTSSIKNISLWDGSVQIGSTIPALNTSDEVLFDLSANPLTVPIDEVKKLAIKADVNSAPYAISGTTVSLKIPEGGIYYKSQVSGLAKAAPSFPVSGNIMYIYKTVLTASTNASTPSGAFLPGVSNNNRVMIFNVANNGDYEATLNRVSFNIAYTQGQGSPTTQASRKFYLFDMADMSNIIGTGFIPPTTTINSFNLSIDLNPDYAIPGASTKTLVLAGDVSDLKNGSTIQFSINSGSNFVWDDNSGPEVISVYSKNFPVYGGALSVSSGNAGFIKNQMANASQIIINLIEALKGLIR
jgi:hypothetical protein